MKPKSRQRMSWLVAGVLLMASGPSLAAPQEAAKPPAASEFAWLAGSWEYVHGQQTTEEYWTPVSSNGLLGMGRTLAGGRMVFFEYLRIEWRTDGVYYVAQPRGRAATDFKLKSYDGATAMFENPTHDFPQRIIYRRNADGSVTARIEGTRSGQQAGESFEYKRRN